MRQCIWFTAYSVSTRTDVVGLIKDNDSILGHILGHLLRHFRVKKIVERIDDNVDKWELRRVVSTRYLDRTGRKTYGSSDCEVWTGSVLPAIFQNVSQCVNSWRNERVHAF